jgi:ribonuclease J
VNKSLFNGMDGAQQTQIKERKANVVTREPKLRIIPLGGLGEVGKNMMAIEFENDIIVVDMGFAFPDEFQPGIDYIIPDISYLEKNKHKVRAIIITHGHMDHIGAAGYVLPKLQVPVYGSRLSLAFVEKQIEEFRLQTKPDFRVIDPDKHEKVQVGAFNIELVRVTHSIADATAVVIKTPVGTLIHTGDWRLDKEPMDGKPMDLPRFAEIAKEGVLMLMSDSTRCDAAGRTPSEKRVEPTLEDLFGRANGRVIISTFASSLTRVQLIIDAAHKTNRKLAFVGRSMLANVELSVKLGYLKVPPGLITRVQDTSRLKDEEIVVLCTGSQGELNSALNRMSTGDHPHIKIKAGDSIIFSSSPIPGNETSVVTTVDALMREGARVYQNSTRDLDHHDLLHVSGHASRDDVEEFINIIKPKYYMPIHGEFHHLVRNAEIAVECGVLPANIFVLDNGDVIELAASGAKKADRVSSGIVLIDGAGVGDVQHVVLHDRLTMSADGIFVVVATVDRKTGKLVSSPDIISRGFIYMKDNEELIGRVRGEIRKSFEQRNTREPTDWAKFKLRLRDDVSDMLYKKTKRNPMIIPVINEV